MRRPPGSTLRRLVAAALMAQMPALVAPVRAAGQPVVHDGESAPAKAWRTAMEHGDLAALAGMYDAASVVLPPDQLEVKGTQAIMKGYADLFSRYTVTVAVDDAHWITQPPLVVSWGLTTLTLHPKAGGPASVQRTRFTDAAVSAGGGWRYVVDHASVVPGR